MIQVAIIFHVIGIRTAIGKNGSRYPAFSVNVMVTTYFTDVFGPASYTYQFSIIGSKHLLCFWGVNGQLRVFRDVCSKIFHCVFRFIKNRYRQASIFPRLKPTIEHTDISYAGIHHDKCIADGANITGRTSGKFISIIREHKLSVQNHGGVCRYTMLFQCFFQFFRAAAVPGFRSLQGQGIHVNGTGNMATQISFAVAVMAVNHHKFIVMIMLRPATIYQFADPLSRNKVFETWQGL